MRQPDEPTPPIAMGECPSRLFTLPICVLSALLLAPAVLLAATTGELTGFVVDQAGVPLSGALVSTSSPAQIGEDQTATTGAEGFFRFPRLAPGSYAVHIELVGYRPQQLEEVQLRLDRVTEVQVELEPVSFGDTVDVFETTPMVDPVQVSAGQTFTAEYMTRTRTDWGDLILQTAGASQNFRRVLGSTPQDSAYFLDGLDATNWYERFPNRAAFDLPFDAIQEVAMHTGGFEAEYGQATGPVVSVVTKSGGNRFSGTFDARYTDSGFESRGEHYDPEEQISEESRVAATLGGPILRDRLWFFTTAGRTILKTTPTGAPTTLDVTTEIFLGKLTWQSSPAWSLVGKLSDTPNIAENYGSSQFLAVEATAIWDTRPSIASLEVAGILSQSVFWSLRLGRKEWDQTVLPEDGDLETIGHVNLVTGENYGNWSSQWYAESAQDEVQTDVSWFSNGPAGSHELKAGLGYGDPGFRDQSCSNGSGEHCAAGVEGFFFRDLSADAGAALPYLMVVEKAEGASAYGGVFHTAYLQDAWRLRRDLAFKLGLRFDRTTYDNNTGEIADLHKVQPRFGLAWDLSGNGRTLLRASWGRFMHPGTTILAAYTRETSAPTEYWLSCSQSISVDPEVCAAMARDQGLGYRTDPENWDPAGWLLDPANVFSSSAARAADGLRAGYADQWIVGLERELFRRSSLELTYLHKASKDMFDDTCNGNVPDPTPGAACDFYVVDNLPQIRFDYDAFMLRFESRRLDWLHLLASWVISESKGAMNFNAAVEDSFNVYPFHFENRYGYLYDQSRHRVKLNGYLLLPLDFTVAINGWWESDFRWTPVDPLVPGMPYGVLLLEPRGSRKAGDLYRLDLQLGKAFRIGRTRLEILARIINALDSENPNQVCGRVTGCGEFAMGDATAWQQPRRFEAGLRIEF